jgi:hypothetical protein
MRPSKTQFIRIAHRVQLVDTGESESELLELSCTPGRHGVDSTDYSIEVARKNAEPLRGSGEVSNRGETLRFFGDLSRPLAVPDVPSNSAIDRSPVYIVHLKGVLLALGALLPPGGSIGSEWKSRRVRPVDGMALNYRIGRIDGDRIRITITGTHEPEPFADGAIRHLSPTLRHEFRADLQLDLSRVLPGSGWTESRAYDGQGRLVHIDRTEFSELREVHHGQ